VTEAILAHHFGRGPPIELTASQAAVINYESAQLAREVLVVTNLHQRHQPYTAPTQCSTMAIRFLAACFNGSYRLAMLVCLSQAPGCGWETWFSLQYGIDLSKLAAPCVPQLCMPLDRALQLAEKKFLEARVALKKTPRSGAPASKYYPKQKIHFLSSKDNLKRLHILKNKLTAL
jgi:hypothetical protein